MTDEQLQDTVYQVSEATNDDGTIDGTVEFVKQEDDEIVLNVMPLVPMADMKEYRFTVPDVVSEKYQIVKICNVYVGSFDALPQLEGERVKLDPDDEYKLIYDESQPSNDESGVEWHKLGEGIGILLGGASVLGGLVMIALLGIQLLALPFIEAYLGFWQNVSVFATACVVLWIGFWLLEYILPDVDE